MMINPWLSDISGDYLDQPTDINDYVMDVVSLICKFAINFCSVGKQMFLKEVWANRLHKVYSIEFFSIPPNLTHDVSTYRPRQNITVDWFS